jgi:hypothetical protein
VRHSCYEFLDTHIISPRCEMKTNLRSHFRICSLHAVVYVGIVFFGVLGQFFITGNPRLLAAERTVAAPVPKEAVKPFAPPVVIAGNAHERGVAYGKQFRAEIHDFLDQQIYGPFVGNPSSKEEMLGYAKDCREVVRSVDLMLSEENAGIAEGAGITPDEATLLQLHEEIYHRGTLPVKHGHCTVVAVSPSDSGDKHAYLGQTWDWMTSVAGKSFLIEWQRDGMSVIGYSYGGLPFGAGMNSNGIALCWTSAALSARGQSPRIGMPSYTFITHLLNQKNIESVINEAQRIKNAGWFTFVVNDADGNIVNIEGSPSGITVERSDKFMVRADYRSADKKAEMAQLVPKWRQAARCVTFDNLLTKTAGKNSKSQIEQYLQDPKFGIASAGIPQKRNVSIDVMLFDTTAKKAYVSRGPDYGIDWREYGFSDVK